MKGVPVMSEEWRPIAGAPDYEVSSEGRVRSWRSNRWPGRRETPKLMTGTLDTNGYPSVYLSKGGGIPRRIRIHSLVIEAFIGPRPPGLVAAHEDGNPQNCRADNLSWKTMAENQADSLRHGTRQLGERKHNALLTEAKVREIRARHAAGESFAALGRAYGVAYETIRSAVNGQSWRHV